MIERAVALAPAKINIGLEVTGKQADGLHDIVSILQTIAVYDRLEWTATGTDFIYESPTGIDAPLDLTRAALDSALDRESWTGRLRLHKSIPFAAGLGGGSTDAALALKLAFPNVDDPSTLKTASRLGSDVPFFLEGGTSLATGNGTDLEPLPDLNAWCVIVTPRVLIPEKTRTLYSALSPADYSDGNTVRSLASDIPIRIARWGAPPNAFTNCLMDFPAIRAARTALQLAGASWVSVSGAGPSLYTLVGAYSTAKSIASRLPPGIGEIFVARTVERRSQHLAAENLARRLRGGSVSR